MTIFLLLQGVMVLIVLNVLVSRYAKRRHEVQRNQLSNDEAALRQLDLKIAEAQRHEHAQRIRIEGLTDSIALVGEHLAAAEKEMETLRQAPPDLYFVFDRLEPRPGIIWEVEVARAQDVPLSGRLAALWKHPRRYLIAAKTPKEAHDRASQRFFEKAGLMVERVAPCPLFLPKRPDAGVELGSIGAPGATPREARVPAPAPAAS